MKYESQIIEVGFVVRVSDISDTIEGEMIGKIFYWQKSRGSGRNNAIELGIQKLAGGVLYDLPDEIKLMLKLDTSGVIPDVFPILKPNLIEHGRSIAEFLSLRDNSSDKNTCRFYVKENNEFFKKLIRAMFKITGVVCYYDLFSDEVVTATERAYGFSADPPSE